MTLQDEAEVRRTSVGTKVLMVGFAVLAVLGSFWTIVWFIRSYVEAPRITMAPMALAARESAPVAASTSAVAEPATVAAPQAPAAPPAVITAEAASSRPVPTEPPPVTGGIADRWAPITPAPLAAPVAEAPAAAMPVAAEPSNEPAADEVTESSVPAITGAAPLPRRKPTQTAAVRPRLDPPLPRPRPDGPAPQSVWTAVPTSDDRFPQQ